MNCPNCGNPEQERVRVCSACGTTYASQDLQELRQLEEESLNLAALWRLPVLCSM